ncbi:MAG: glutathione S-transferase family protein [Deltaproteobacteria bacterium]|nr:MAG: glutathione S-transferase family protein [Deltaproteobacteria bacterium]
MTLRLYVAPYSPWSEMARWALEAQGVPFQSITMTPIFGSPGARLRTRRLRGPLRSPVAVKDGRVLSTALDIARFGSERSLHPLLCERSFPEVQRWSSRADRMLQAGRVRTIERVRGSQDAVREYLPAPAARLRKVGGMLGCRGARLLTRKLPPTLQDQRPIQVLRDDLERLRAALEGRTYLVNDSFTFADIAAACALQFVEPASERWFRLGEASRPLWRDPELADDFADLLAWRDRIYALHREATPAVVAREDRATA